MHRENAIDTNIYNFKNTLVRDLAWVIASPPTDKSQASGSTGDCLAKSVVLKLRLNFISVTSIHRVS